MSEQRQMDLSEFGAGSSDTNSNSDEIVCPTCGKDDFTSEHGLKIHHTTIHNDKSLTNANKVEFECERCGETEQLTPEETDRRRFCSMDCKAAWQSGEYSGKGNPGWEGGKVTVACDYCGETVQRGPSEVNDITYCSDSCESNWKSENRVGENHPRYNQVSIECDWCGTTLERSPSRVEKFDRQFCNSECRGAYFSANPSELHEQERVTVHCDWCGESDERIPHRVSRNQFHFCDNACKGEWRSEYVTGDEHPNWKGGFDPYYGPNWVTQRELTRERDNYRCVLCGVSDSASQIIHDKELAVHHVTRLNDFDNPVKANELSNLLTVCTFCHQRVFD